MSWGSHRKRSLQRHRVPEEHLNQEAVCIFGSGDWAGLVLTKDLVSMGRDKAICPVADRSRNDAKHAGKYAPDASELGEYGDGGVRLGEKLFHGLTGIE